MSASGAKAAMRNLYGLLDVVEELQPVPDGIAMSLKELFKYDLHRYLMYLSASDGKIKAAERDYMNELFDTNMSIQDYVDFINESDTYSIDFENDVPMSMKIMAFFDAKCDILGSRVGTNAPNMVPLILDFYKKVGIEFIACDGDIDDQEKNDLVAYLAKKHLVLAQIIETFDVEDAGRIGKKKGL